MYLRTFGSLKSAKKLGSANCKFTNYKSVKCQIYVCKFADLLFVEVIYGPSTFACNNQGYFQNKEKFDQCQKSYNSEKGEKVMELSEHKLRHH